MRILHILDHSLPLHSGYSFRTVSILREQRALGWETIQLTTPRHGRTQASEEEAEGWRFLRTPYLPGLLSHLPVAGVYLDEMRATRSRLATLVRDIRPDVIHAHSPVLNVLPALSLARRYGVPLVYEMRASWEDAAVDHGTMREGGLRYRASRALETYALRRVAAITTICEGLRSDIVARGLDPARITVIPNGVDVHRFAAGRRPDPQLRRSLGLEGATVVGFAGSFYGYEGLDLLIGALARLLPQRPLLRLLLIGGGPQDGALKAQVSALRLDDKVVFTGRVPHEDMQRYYDQIDVLAYPRRSMRLTELVTPLKPLEAMAQGRMLVASDVGGHRELIRDGETGSLFRAGDVEALATAIDDILVRAKQWPQIAAQARRFVEAERSWTASVARYRQVYEAVMARAAPGQAVAATHQG